MNQAFARPIKQKSDVINRLLNLNFELGEPYKFISEVRLLLSSFKDLNIDIEDILQYCIWLSIPLSYQTQLLHITNSRNPSVKQIEDCIYEAIERVKSSSMQQSHGSFAANISLSQSSGANSKSSKNTNSFRSCVLCEKSGKSDHPIFRCSKYDTPSLKISKLKELDLCTKCGGSKHTSQNCKFRFYRNCNFCQKSTHFSYLCSQSKPSKGQVNNGVCAIEMGSLSTGGLKGNMIPTFSCKLADGEVLRCLQDSGAETSFIRSDIAAAHNFKLISTGIALTIKGFNSNKTICTNIVEAEVFINGKCCCFPAVVVPHIAAVPCKDGVAAVGKLLTENGYILADKFLVENPGRKLDMVLGIDALSHLQTQTILIGENSCMLQTCIGVMPVGNSQKFLSDLSRKISCSALSSAVNSDKENGLNLVGENILELNNFFISCDQSEFNLENDIFELKDSQLNDKCENILNYHRDMAEDLQMSEMDLKKCKEVLDNMEKSNGKYVVPLIWHESNSHLLAKNFGLCRKILHSVKDKVKKIPSGLQMIDDVIAEQVKLKIINPIEDLTLFLNENPDCSFIAHMPVYKMSSKTTKCRVVYLANLAEKSRHGNAKISHNQALLPGPQLNRTLQTAFSLLRFGRNLVIYDLQKAYLQLLLREKEKRNCVFYGSRMFLIIILL